ncbi:MAG: alpha-L-rhamnosidase C-terminal domain-containing protein [Lacipirellulaceae bacterium]
MNNASFWKHSLAVLACSLFLAISSHKLSLAVEQNSAVQWVRPANVRWKSEGEGLTKTAAPNQWFCFRNVITLPAEPKDGTAKIACDSKYWLWINGKLVVFEGQLKRGPTPTDTYYDFVDLKPHLQVGENTVAVLVWYFGKQGFSHRDSGSPGLLFEIVGGREAQIDSSQWKAIPHPAYGDSGNPKPNYRLPESNIVFDARDDLVDWQLPGFDDTNWPAAIEVGVPGTEPWNKLIKRPLPLWKDYGLRDYLGELSFPLISDGSPIVCKLPYNAQVTPYLKVEAEPGLQIGIQTDNYRGGSEPNVRAEYITREGVQEFESLGWISGHEVRYSIPEGVKVLSLKYRETGYDTEFTGSFQCDDPDLNTLWQKAQRTLYVTMRDTYMDCPDRERAQWWGDEVIELEEAFYALDPQSHHLARKGILELARWQKPGGQLYSPVPAGNWDKELPTQMLASVGEYGFWNYYWHTGDQQTIKLAYPAVKGYLELWQVDDQGLVVPRKGDWTWGDWGENKDMPLLFNGWYSLALEGYAKMSDLLGEHDEANKARSRRAALHDSFNRTYWNGEAYRSPGYQGETDERGHALAVLAGIAEPTKYPAIREVFATQEHASPYMEKYVLEAMYKMDLPEQARTRMKRRYRAMIDSPLTTLWEGWGIGSQGFGGGTYNHAWSGGPLTLMSKYVAGIAPIELGYKRFAVRPNLGELSQVEATVDSVAGKIELTIERTDKRMSIAITVPEGSTAEVTLPADYSELTSVVRVLQDREMAVQPVDLADEATDSETITLFPGKWKLVASTGA